MKVSWSEAYHTAGFNHGFMYDTSLLYGSGDDYKPYRLHCK